MSAKLETFFELKQVIDHDCGNYQIGEIDFVNYGAIREYVGRHGELGYQQLMWVLPRLMTEAQNEIVRVRSSGQACAQAVESQEPLPNTRRVERRRES